MHRSFTIVAGVIAAAVDVLNELIAERLFWMMSPVSRCDVELSRFFTFYWLDGVENLIA